MSETTNVETINSRLDRRQEKMIEFCALLFVRVKGENKELIEISDVVNNEAIGEKVPQEQSGFSAGGLSTRSPSV